MDEDPECVSTGMRALETVKDYVVSPLHWDSHDWIYFAGAAAAIGATRHYDEDVRRHFTAHSATSLSTSNTHELQDALPAAVMLIGTWGFANLINDNEGRREAGTMLEAASLSLGTAYVVKFSTDRQGPDQSVDSNHWRSGGRAFPSEHATLAFSIGTVLAESGNDEYRWIRRAVGYGAATFTAYERLDHNVHWLSDTVAGAALGIASARFSINRRQKPSYNQALMLTPLPGGLLLRYTRQLP